MTFEKSIRIKFLRTFALRKQQMGYGNKGI